MVRTRYRKYPSPDLVLDEASLSAAHNPVRIPSGEEVVFSNYYKYPSVHANAKRRTETSKDHVNVMVQTGSQALQKDLTKTFIRSKINQTSI